MESFPVTFNDIGKIELFAFSFYLLEEHLCTEHFVFRTLVVLLLLTGCFTVLHSFFKKKLRSRAIYGSLLKIHHFSPESLQKIS